MIVDLFLLSINPNPEREIGNESPTLAPAYIYTKYSTIVLCGGGPNHARLALVQCTVTPILLVAIHRRIHTLLTITTVYQSLRYLVFILFTFIILLSTVIYYTHIHIHTHTSTHTYIFYLNFNVYTYIYSLTLSNFTINKISLYIFI